MSWVAVVGTVAQAGYGIYQHQKGKRMEEEAGERPEYQIPESAQRALGTAQLRSMQGIDAETKNQMLQEMDRSRMASLSQVAERRGGLGTVVGLEQAQQDSLRKMGAMDIAQRERNIQALQEQRGIMAGYEQEKRADELTAWEQESQAAAAMKGAGIQNIAGAVTSGLGAAAKGIAAKKAAKTAADNTMLNVTGKSTGLGEVPGGENNQIIGGTGYTGGALNSQNYSFNQGTGKFEFNSPTSPFATGGGLSMSGQAGSLTSKIDPSGISGNLGFNKGFGYNEGITSNMGLSGLLNKFDNNNQPSTQRQLFGASGGSGGGLLSNYKGLVGGSGAGGGLLSGGSGSGSSILGDEWKKNFPLLFPGQQ